MSDLKLDTKIQGVKMMLTACGFDSASKDCSKQNYKTYVKWVINDLTKKAYRIYSFETTVNNKIFIDKEIINTLTELCGLWETVGILDGSAISVPNLLKKQLDSLTDQGYVF